jgi:hypothetical protein
MVEKVTAALPTAQRRTPAGLYNSRLNSADPQQQLVPAPRGGSGIGPGAALPAVRVASLRVMANATRESSEVAPDPGLWDLLSTLAAEMRVKGPDELYLKEYSQKANHIRASTYDRASIACFYESVGVESCAFLDITGSVIAKLRHRAGATDKPVYTLALSVPTPAGTRLDRSKPLRCLTSHGTGLLGAAEVKVVVEDFRGAECEHFGGNVYLPYMVRSCPPPHEERERARSTARERGNVCVCDKQSVNDVRDARAMQRKNDDGTDKCCRTADKWVTNDPIGRAGATMECGVSGPVSCREGEKGLRPPTHERAVWLAREV